MRSIAAPQPPHAAAGQEAVPQLIAATSLALPEQAGALARARAFAEPLLSGETLETGENTFAHAEAVAAILKTIGGSEAMQAASYLVHACSHLNKPEEVIAKAFGQNFATLAVETTKLMRVQHHAREAQLAGHAVDDPATHTENVRKMLLAFSRDLRVVMLRLASRLQTLRFYAASKRPVSPSIAREALQVFAPLANRLGIWQMKWELEDLSFRFLEPDTYKQIARLLDEKRAEREVYMEQLRGRLESELRARSISATVQGRPKHIYSIVKKMRGKSLDFDQVFDIRALRVVVPTVKDCYAALSWVHSHFKPIDAEFDDYIAKPKPNGYQSLHTVVRDEAGKAIEIQIRTQAMHDHAEHGVAAHWAYKEAGAKGYAGVSASSEYDAKIAVLRQLLAWERDMAGAVQHRGLFEDRIYVLTPNAEVVELPQGATPVDFAYAVHTSVGHRCRGARVDGAMVPLNTPLHNGQTVEITTVKEGRPSRDWLNPELGYLTSHRARAKVRAWFNAQATHETVARGREAVEKLLQREGKTAIRLEDLAVQLGFKTADALFEVVGKDEFSLRTIETLLRPPEPVLQPDDYLLLKKARTNESAPKGGVLVVGIDSLMTQLAKCCRPAPPDPIRGFVTRGKGVSVHRADCSNFREMAARSAERVIDVEWGSAGGSGGGAQGGGQGGHPALLYPVDVAVEAADRQGLLRDISEVFAREKTNVIGVQTQSVKGTAWMTFTVEVSDSGRLNKVLSIVAAVQGVRSARRR
ncbi:bifunctional (p)ppGpp synthetase/guanosine-3',5'-bis(diphosphate) 3'-pyrophosphohydrolase [Paracidovorax citrulli]|uniref:GTP pyrophosphokinase n=2 Tax=Paracidovorax citrulli TaxID=80869 RepID=A1TMI9_PARC0|nr:bifunctional (p)ppGpp synthetase/guanosine-3',5'-bis(diphosphate) 3'-pyrophosphohydrolase [Paracidovorax citrulli]ABM32177.1 (p)ppGpp synthetase I, SpoT/RelA [Paracidovorax citrulli AAC00-1]ATG94807.1 bifunctional (p)ppGpp synthetase/guanosine-3',5'-bis(diphosphate) 3'-pyrophosphohydrolase [Paracidovorax citrulli]PVY66366.1 GTP pyrophosphokinase [Paracidovorax citrulli]QCX12098.1 GTP pyrophosphokinase [Paracidovorax citrulli]REG69462.1 GTP pyrophosphokinase [Paracidovorax citrulli]